MMKYQEPVFEITYFKDKDVVTASDKDNVVGAPDGWGDGWNDLEVLP